MYISAETERDDYQAQGVLIPAERWLFSTGCADYCREIIQHRVFITVERWLSSTGYAYPCREMVIQQRVCLSLQRDGYPAEGVLIPAERWLSSRGCAYPCREMVIQHRVCLSLLRDGYPAEGVLSPVERWLSSRGCAYPVERWLFSTGRAYPCREMVIQQRACTFCFCFLCVDRFSVSMEIYCCLMYMFTFQFTRKKFLDFFFSFLS